MESKLLTKFRNEVKDSYRIRKYSGNDYRVETQIPGTQIWFQIVEVNSNDLFLVYDSTKKKYSLKECEALYKKIEYRSIKNMAAEYRSIMPRIIDDNSSENKNGINPYSYPIGMRLNYVISNFIKKFKIGHNTHETI